MANKRKPTVLKVIEGTARADRAPRNEPKPKKRAPSCPTWLLREAKAEWKRVVKELEPLGVLTGVDRACLAAYCQLWARIHELETQGNGASAAMFTQLRLYAVELGLTPSSRGGIDTGPADDTPTGGFAGLKSL